MSNAFLFIMYPIVTVLLFLLFGWIYKDLKTFFGEGQFFLLFSFLVLFGLFLAFIPCYISGRWFLSYYLSGPSMEFEDVLGAVKNFYELVTYASLVCSLYLFVLKLYFFMNSSFNGYERLYRNNYFIAAYYNESNKYLFKYLDYVQRYRIFYVIMSVIFITPAFFYISFLVAIKTTSIHEKYGMIS